MYAYEAVFEKWQGMPGKLIFYGIGGMKTFVFGYKTSREVESWDPDIWN